jgi:hypothetical protein
VISVPYLCHVDSRSNETTDDFEEDDDQFGFDVAAAANTGANNSQPKVLRDAGYIDVVVDENGPSYGMASNLNIVPGSVVTESELATPNDTSVDGVPPLPRLCTSRYPVFPGLLPLSFLFG